MENIRRFIFNNKFKIIITLVFILGISVRVLGIIQIPYGLNQDEASAGYEAYSIMVSGMDRKRRKFSRSLYCMGKWTECIVFIYYDIVYCLIWAKCINSKITYGYCPDAYHYL